MRIGIFYRDYEAGGGFPRDWRRFAWELAELGEQVTVYTYSAGAPRPRHENIEVKRFCGRATLSFAVPERLSTAVMQDSHGLDVLELVGAFIPENIAMARVARKAGIPYVYSPLGQLAPKIIGRNPVKKRIFIHGFLRHAMRNAAGIHSFSAIEETWIERYMSRPTIRTALGAFPEDMPDDLDRNYLRRRLQLPDERVILLYLGRLDAAGKGLTTLIEALALMREERRTCHTVLIGPDEHGNRALLEAQIHRAGLGHQVSILDALAAPDKFSAMASADLFVYPSNYDIIPRSIREALSVGCPVIASIETQVADILHDYGAGVTTSVEPREIGQAIARLVVDRPKLRAMRAHAKRAGREALDWRDQATRLRNGYRGLVGQRDTTSR